MIRLIERGSKTEIELLALSSVLYFCILSIYKMWCIVIFLIYWCTRTSYLFTLEVSNNVTHLPSPMMMDDGEWRLLVLVVLTVVL